MELMKRKTTLEVPSPFSLKATALSHGWHECAPVSWCEGGGCFQVIQREKDKVYRVSVTPTQSAKRIKSASGRTRRSQSTKLSVIVEGDTVSDQYMAVTKRHLRVMLGLDYDLSEFYQLCKTHPTLHVLEKMGAGRGLRSVCMVENLIKMICGTNVTWAQAVKMINRLGQLGPAFPDYRNLNAWPTPREILKAGEKYLLEVCRVGYRAGSILTLCQDFCDGQYDPNELDDLAACPEVTDDDLIKKLTSIRGVGPTTANYTLSFFGRHGRLSIDTATVAHVARTHTKGRKPTIKQIEKIYAKYGPWKNKVWWYEHWLNWTTARQILEDNGFG